MAHSNPEFALGLMRPTVGPVSAQKRDIPTVNDMVRWMRDIAYRVRKGGYVSEADQAAYDAYTKGMAYYRAKAEIEAVERNDRSEPAGGAMGQRPKAGERFVEPKRRVHPDVQRGRVKVRRARPL